MTHLVQGDTALTPSQGPTYASLSVQVGGMEIRRAAATARLALTTEAAELWRVDAGDLMTVDGAVRTASGSRQISYAELVRGKELALSIDAKAPLLDPAKYRIVGRSVPRVDIPGKVTGEFIFMQDVRVPGMLHARVVRPPAFGAKLLTVDEASIKSPIPGARPVGAQRKFSRGHGEVRMGGDPRRPRAQGHVERMERPARLLDNLDQSIRSHAAR